MAISAAGERLRETINQLKELAQISGKTTPELVELRTALDTLFQRSTSAGTSPTKQMVDDVHILLRLVEQYGRSWRMVSTEVRNAAMDVRAIHQRQQQGGIPFYPQIQGGDPDKITNVKATGSQEGLNRLLEDEARLLLALDTGLDNLAAKYESMGFTLGNVKTELDATNAAYSFQAQLLRKVGDEVTFVRDAQGRASASTGQTMAPSRLVEDLQTRLGGRFNEFDRHINKMGLSMDDLNSAQIDAVTGVGRFAFKTGEAGEAVRTATFHLDKWGRLIGDSSNRFKTFDAMIANNISKVLRWAVAVGTVYAAWGKVQQMGTDMVELQDVMADLAITTGESTEKMSAYFESVSEIARETGTDLKASIQTMTSAMRAAGGETGADRTAVALALLSDTASYAKLSGLDMAKAMDILVSSLRQLGMPLSEGDALLNKWVAVSKVAHTSLLDLGQAFATAAAAADSAGVGVDALNGLIATMAEVTNLSAQESANAIRAILSSIQMPSTQEALGKYGIAVKDANGELRDMENILTDVNLLITDFGDGAVLGEKAISELAYAMGGQGARRQAQTIALLKGLNRARDISNVSAAASTDLEDALAIKTDTLATAVGKLNNSFVELAQSLGSDGGMLDVFSGVIDMLTGFVDLLKDITEATGPATTAIIALTAAWAIANKTALMPKLASAFGGGGGMDPSLAFMAGGGAAGGGVGRSALGGAGAGLAIGAVHAIQAAQGEMEATEAATRIGASIAGGIVGNMLLPGAGGLIGAYIGDAFAGSAISALKARQGELTGVAVGELSKYEERIAQQLKDLQAGKTAVPVYARGREEEILKERLAELRQTIKMRTPIEAGGMGGIPEAPAQQRRFLQYQQQLQPQLETEFAKRRMELPFEFAKGEIESARDYTLTLERMETLTNAMLPIFDAMSMGLRHNGDEVGNAGEKFVQMGKEMSGWSDESVQFILDQALVIVELSNNLEKTGEGYDALAARLKAFPKLYEGLRRTEMAYQFEIPGFKDFADYSQGEFEQVISAARELQEQFAEQLGIPDEAFDSIERWAALAGENFQWVEGVMEQFVMDAKKSFDDLKSSQEDSFNVKRLQDVDPSKMGEIAQANRYWIEYLSRLKGMSAQEYLNVEGEQFNLILGEGNVLQQLNSTSEAMLFALQDIKDIEEKQLEGMWNIPSGATFWVPITSAFYKDQAGGGGYPELPELIPPTNRTADATEGTEIGVKEVGTGLNALTDTMRTMLTDISFDPGKVITDLFYELGKLGVTQTVAEGEDLWGKQPEWVQNMLEGYRMPSGDFFSPEHMRDVLKEELFLPGLDKLKPPEEPEAIPSLITSMTDLATKINSWFTRQGMDITGKDSMELMQPQETPPVDVSVEIPEINGNFTIENKVMLDGRQITSYIDRVLAVALAKVARANAKTSSGTMR